jgi:hypothetical protein
MVGVGNVVGSLLFKAAREAVRLDLNRSDFRRGSFGIGGKPVSTYRAGVMNGTELTSPPVSETESSGSSSRQRG